MRPRIGKATIAGILLAICLIAGVMLHKIVMAEPLDSYHTEWRLIRETATEDAANFAAVYDLAAAEGDFASKDSSTVAAGGPYQIVPKPTNFGGASPGAVWQFAISGGLAENDTFSFVIAAWSRTNGMLQVIAEGDGIIGTQDVVLYPDDSATATNIWWADTLNLDATTLWPGIASKNSGNNQVAFILIDTTGIEWLQFIIFDAGGGGTEANNITVFGREY